MKVLSSAVSIEARQYQYRGTSNDMHSLHGSFSHRAERRLNLPTVKWASSDPHCFCEVPWCSKFIQTSHGYPWVPICGMEFGVKYLESLMCQ